ncbi:uncharacterized protein LOC143423584 [Xylocopa sonorina]|uniref:uncharacterized protein LOC143423584 n=1 Tax=Xylocopa sonorina TaxID=1818115 RepID=UPI00403A7EC4
MFNTYLRSFLCRKLCHCNFIVMFRNNHVVKSVSYFDGHGLTYDNTSNIIDLLEYREMATWTEDEIGRKWDRCFTDTLFKFGGGILLGGVYSLLFGKRKKWPIIIGAGFGLGAAYVNCQEDLNSTIRQQKSLDCSKPGEGKKSS